jgi:hypothetical protein
MTLIEWQAVTRGGSQVELAAAKGLPVPSWLVAPVVSLNTATGDDAAAAKGSAPSHDSEAPTRVTAADNTAVSTAAVKHAAFVRPPAAPAQAGDAGWLAAAPAAPKHKHSTTRKAVFKNSESEWMSERSKLYKAVSMFHKFGDSALETLIPARKTAAMLKRAKQSAQREIHTLQQTAAQASKVEAQAARTLEAVAKGEKQEQALDRAAMHKMEHGKLAAAEREEKALREQLQASEATDRRREAAMKAKVERMAQEKWALKKKADKVEMRLQEVPGDSGVAQLVALKAQIDALESTEAKDVGALKEKLRAVQSQTAAMQSQGSHEIAALRASQRKTAARIEAEIVASKARASARAKVLHKHMAHVAASLAHAEAQEGSAPEAAAPGEAAPEKASAAAAAPKASAISGFFGGMWRAITGGDVRKSAPAKTTKPGARAPLRALQAASGGATPPRVAARPAAAAAAARVGPMPRHALGAGGHSRSNAHLPAEGFAGTDSSLGCEPCILGPDCHAGCRLVPAVQRDALRPHAGHLLAAHAARKAVPAPAAKAAATAAKARAAAKAARVEGGSALLPGVNVETHWGIDRALAGPARRAAAAPERHTGDGMLRLVAEARRAARGSHARAARAVRSAAGVDADGRPAYFLLPARRAPAPAADPLRLSEVLHPHASARPEGVKVKYAAMDRH